jgi:AraC-like DNA-binding protein
MQLNYIIEPVFVEEVCYVVHKGKKRDFSGTMHAHGPKYHEIIYLDYGKINVALDGSDIHVHPGECILIHGGSKHSFTGESGAPFDYLNITFRGTPPLSLFSRSIPVNRRCLEILERLKQESLLEMPYCREVIASSLTELVAHLLRQVEVSIPDKLPESANLRRYQSEVVNRAMKVIADRYSKPLNLRHLSQAAGIGESRLRKLLKIETGETFSTILHKQRITAAKHLLSEGAFSLEEISNAVGYQYPAFFFKIFKRLTGMTPKAYSQSLGDPTENA